MRPLQKCDTIAASKRLRSLIQSDREVEVDQLLPSINPRSIMMTHFQLAIFSFNVMDEVTTVLDQIQRPQVAATPAKSQSLRPKPNTLWPTLPPNSPHWVRWQSTGVCQISYSLPLLP